MSKSIYLACMGIAFGAFIIVLSIGAVPFDPLITIGGFLLILGIGVSGYGFLTNDLKFFLVWGSVLTIAGLGVLLKDLINPLVFVGVLIIVLAIIAAFVPGRRV